MAPNPLSCKAGYGGLDPRIGGGEELADSLRRRLDRARGQKQWRPGTAKRWQRGDGGSSMKDAKFPVSLDVARPERFTPRALSSRNQDDYATKKFVVRKQNNLEWNRQDQRDQGTVDYF